MGKEIIFISNIDNLGATVDLSEYYLSKRGTAEFGRYTIAEFNWILLLSDECDIP